MKLPTTDTLRVDAPFAIITIVATLGAGALAVAPYVLDRGPTPQQQLELIAERKKIATDTDSDLARRSKEEAELAAKCASAVRLLPASKLNTRIVEITALAGECSASISQLAPQPVVPPVAQVAGAGAGAAPTPREKAVVIPIRIAGTATYADATRFLRGVRTRFRDTAVTNIRIAAAPSETSPAATFTFDLAWYTAPANSAVFAGESSKTP